MEKKRNKHDVKKTPWKKITGIVILVLALIYGGISLFFTYHYYAGTTINGYDCEFKNIEDVKAMIKGTVSKYKIRVKERDGKEEFVTAKQTGLSFVDDGKLEKIMEEQKGYAWVKAFFEKYIYRDGITLDVDQEALNKTVNQMDAFNKELVVAPKSAYSKYDEKSDSYVIVDEVYGNTIKKKRFMKYLKEAIIAQEKEWDVEKAECYKNPKYKKDSKEIVKSNKKLNKYVSTELTYDFGDRSQKLSGKKIHKWLYLTKKFEVKIHREMVEKYVEDMADKYDTLGRARYFTSIAGNEVSVEGGTYGWKIDQEEETEKLVGLIKKGKKGTREPEYEHIAKSRNSQDLGDTYVEVDLGSQHMWFYKNGQILVSTPVVTGDTSKGRGTPTGVYYILYKDTNRTLRGEGYASHVNYWLPITHSGIGIHDASWRSSYGGSIYRGNGSHGCINTPWSAVRTIYNNIESTYPVVVHW